MVEPMFRSLIASDIKVGDEFALSGAEAKHAATVRRMRVGESIQVGDGRGLRIRGAIRQVSNNEIIIGVASVENEKPTSPQITLVQALAKGDRDELAIQAATELGITAVIPWQADRSVSRWEGPKIAKGVERWRAICAEAAKQSLSAIDPEVKQPLTTKNLADSIGQFDQVLVLDPTAAESFASQLPLAGAIALVVGPEGGISEPELATLKSAGAKLVHLGSSVLRTSTAGMAAISAIRFGR